MRVLYILGLFMLISPYLHAQNTHKLTFHFTTSGTRPGFDLISLLRVYSDNKIIGESKPKKQTEPNEVTLIIPEGKHAIKAVFVALQKGAWEERTIKNQYSYDCIYNTDINLTSDKSINLVFDIANEKIIVDGTPVAKPGTATPATVAAATGNATPPITKTNTPAPPSPVRQPVTGSSPKEITKSILQDELSKMNNYLETFNENVYYPISITNNVWYSEHRSGYHCTVNMNDIDAVVYSDENRSVSLKCSGGKNCITCTGNNPSRATLTYKTSDDNKDPHRLYELMNRFFTDYQQYSGLHPKQKEPEPTDPEVRILQKQINDINEHIKKYATPSYKGLYFENNRLIYDDGKDLKEQVFPMSLDEVKYDATKKAAYILCLYHRGCVENLKTSEKVNRMDFSAMPEAASKKLVDMLKPFLENLKKKIDPITYGQQVQQKKQESEDDDVYNLLGY